MRTTTDPVVGVWTNFWLPKSETFIRDQISELRRWKPRTLGIGQLPETLDIKVDLAPYSMSWPSRASRKLSGPGFLQRKHIKNGLESGIRVMHAHFGTGGVVALPIARGMNIPLAVTFHGHDVTAGVNPDAGSDQKYLRQLNHLFAETHLLIAVSNFIAERLRKLGAPPEKIKVLPIGTQIPVGGFASPWEHKTISFLGRLVPKKGVDKLIEAASLLPADLRNVELIIIGDGPERKALQGLANKLAVRATFKGALPRESALAHVRNSRMFCSPSVTAADGDSEGLPMAIQEASALGLPVVSFTHAGIPEAIQHGFSGLLAPEGNVEELAQNITRLLRDDDFCTKLGHGGRKRIAEVYDMTTCTRNLEHAYDELLELGQTTRGLFRTESSTIG